jgi:hypothetical protein
MCDLLFLLSASLAVSRSIKNKITSLLHLSTANKTAGEHKKRKNKNNFFLESHDTAQPKINKETIPIKTRCSSENPK